MILSNSSLDMTHALIIPALTEEQKDALAAKHLDYVKAPEGYTDVYARDAFVRTSYHCPGRNISIQVSNVLKPDESTETDWVDISSTMTGYVCTDLLFKWVRIKGVQPGDKVYVQSMRFID